MSLNERKHSISHVIKEWEENLDWEEVGQTSHIIRQEKQQTRCFEKEGTWIKRKWAKQVTFLNERKQQMNFVVNERKQQMSHIAKQEEVAKDLHCQLRGSMANNSCHQMRGNDKWLMLSKRGSSKQVTLNLIYLVSILFRNIFWVPQPWNYLDLYIWIPWRFIWYLNCRVYCLLVGQCQRFHLERLKTKGFAWLFEIKVVCTLQ